jgi:hypothetical protein
VLASAINSKRLKKNSWPYNPQDLRSFENEGAWLAVGLTLEGICDLYFGLAWECKARHESRLFVSGTLRFVDETSFRKAWERFSMIGIERIENWPEIDREITIREGVPVGDAMAYPARLDQVISEWVSAWKQAGGLAGLSIEGQKTKSGKN